MPDRVVHDPRVLNSIPISDLIEQYLVLGNRTRTSDYSLKFDQVLGAIAVELAGAFKSFVETLPADSKEKLHVENRTRVALRKLRTLEDYKE